MTSTEKTDIVEFGLQEDITDTTGIITQDSEKYTKIDHLDEDDPIPGQKIVLLSFVSPEGIMNCNIRALKVRGVFDDTIDGNKEAEKKLKQLRKKDKYHDFFRGVVGKWMPICPSSDQVEEERYANKDLNKIMKKPHESELKQKQTLKDLNELVGRHKENLEIQKKQHKQRVKDKVREASMATAETPEKQDEQEEPEEQDEQEEHEDKKPRDYIAHLNRNPEATKERLRKKIEESRAKKQSEQTLPHTKTAKELDETQQKIRSETTQIIQKEQNIAKIKENKEQIEQQLRQMKQMYTSHNI